MKTLLQIWQHHYDSDFKAGVKLLIDHEGEQYLSRQTAARLRLLASSDQKPDAYNLGKLQHALSKIKLDETTATFTTGMDPEPESKIIWTAGHPPVSNIQAQGKVATSAKAKHLHKSHSHYHTLLVNAESDVARAEHAENVLDITRQLDEEYDRLRESAILDNQTADMPPPPAAPSSAAELRKLQSLRARVSHIKNKLIPKSSGKRLADLEKELEKKQAEIQRIEPDIA